MPKRITIDNIIDRARNIHNNKYDYSKSVYLGYDTPMKIICPIHGEFQQTPHNHLNGQNCPFCVHRSFKYTAEECVELAKVIHKDKYQYDTSSFKSMKEKMRIICPIHGEFWQTPHAHINQKQNCPQCRKYKLEEIVLFNLNDKKIVFEREKRFKWLGKLSLDFYLPEYNIAIECQGKQHFGLGGWVKDESKRKTQYRIIKERDERKRELCEKNGIKLIYYSDLKIEYPYKVYTDVNELINEIKK